MRNKENENLIKTTKMWEQARTVKVKKWKKKKGEKKLLKKKDGLREMWNKRKKKMEEKTIDGIKEKSLTW